MNGGFYWQALSVGTALACGLLIGIERGWKLRDQEPGSRVAGVRTFSMLGMGSGIAGLIGSSGHALAAGAIVVGVVAIMVTAYARDVDRRRARPRGFRVPVAEQPINELHAPDP